MSTEARGEENLALVGGRGERGGDEREHEDELVRCGWWLGAQSLRPLAPKNRRIQHPTNLRHRRDTR